MAAYNLVEDYFHRRAWNQTWDYPIGGSLIALDKDFPVLAPFYFSWEVNFSPLPFLTFSRNHYWLAPVTASLFLICVYLGVKWMENRKAFDLKIPLKYWNLFVSIFSFFGAIRVVPHVLYYIHKVGFLSTLCSPSIWSYGTGSVAFWITLFALSKFIEFIDTAFLVLRKKPLTFLHWYHHATAFLYCWDCYTTEQTALIHGAAINYSVHAIMYFYYYLATVGKPPAWGILITMLQIAQLVFGVVIGFFLVYFTSRYNFLGYSTPETAFKPFDVPGCAVVKSSAWYCLLSSSSYLYLFVDLFLNRYIPSKALGGASAKVPQRKRE